MKKIALAVSILAFSAASASAADMAPAYSKAPMVAPVVYSWTGCYLGVNIGGGWQKNSAYDPFLLGYAGGETASGVVGGGQIGCDYQSGPWVFGVQGMFDGAGIKSSHLNPLAPTGTETMGTNTSWFATETARIGYTVTPQTLLYVKGGAAEASFRYTDNDPTVSPPVLLGYTSPYFGNANATRFGWTVGVGVEWAFTPNWTVFLEYNYMDFSTNSTLFNYTDGIPYTYNETNRLQTVLVGVNYRFNLGGPVVARY